MFALKAAIPCLLAVAACGFSPALASERCRVTDPTGTPLNVRDVKLHIIGTIENGQIVYIWRDGEDPSGKPWAYIGSPQRGAIGWVYREFLSCY